MHFNCRLSFILAQSLARCGAVYSILQMAAHMAAALVAALFAALVAALVASVHGKAAACRALCNKIHVSSAKPPVCSTFPEL